MRLLLILFFVLPYFATAQEEPIETKQGLSFTPGLLVYLKHDNDFGNSFLTEAHDSKFPGSGFQFNFLRYRNFVFGLGMEFMTYKVVDITMAGNINKGTTSNVFFKTHYLLNLGDSWSLEPNLGIGGSRFRQKSKEKNLNGFSGTKFYAGTNFTYKFDDVIGVFAGLKYAFTKYQVNTAPEFENYFRNSSQIQAIFGISFTPE